MATRTADPAGVPDATRAFDDAVPGLRVMRNVGEHFYAYATDDPRRHHPSVVCQQSQVDACDATTYSWLDHELNIDTARAAASHLLDAVRATLRRRAELRKRKD